MRVLLLIVLVVAESCEEGHGDLLGKGLALVVLQVSGLILQTCELGEERLEIALLRGLGGLLQPLSDFLVETGLVLRGRTCSVDSGVGVVIPALRLVEVGPRGGVEGLDYSFLRRGGEDLGGLVGLVVTVLPGVF